MRCLILILSSPLRQVTSASAQYSSINVLRSFGTAPKNIRSPEDVKSSFHSCSRRHATRRPSRCDMSQLFTCRWGGWLIWVLIDVESWWESANWDPWGFCGWGLSGRAKSLSGSSTINVWSSHTKSLWWQLSFFRAAWQSCRDPMPDPSHIYSVDFSYL